MDKQALPAKRFVQQSGKWRSLKHRRCGIVLMHTRWATHGSSDNPDNLHPFTSTDEQQYLIHNGVICNHEMLITRNRLQVYGECDSEMLIRLIEKYYRPKDGMHACLRQVQGSMAIALLDLKDGVVYLARNDGRPLWLCKLDNQRWFFASEKNILSEAIAGAFGKSQSSTPELMLPLAADHVYQLSWTGLHTH